MLVNLTLTPGIYRIVAEGRWHVRGGWLSTSKPLAFTFGIDSDWLEIFATRSSESRIAFYCNNSHRRASLA
jgi:hypothetical protein